MRKLQIVLFILIIIGLYILGIYCLMHVVNLFSIAAIGVPICLTGMSLSSIGYFKDILNKSNSFKTTK